MKSKRLQQLIKSPKSVSFSSAGLRSGRLHLNQEVDRQNFQVNSAGGKLVNKKTLIVNSESLAFCKRLSSLSPGIAAILHAHIADYDEVLPHVLLGEVTRYLIASAIPEKSVVEALNVELREGHCEVRELIAVSFVENIENQAELQHLTQNYSAEEIVHQWYSQQD